MQSWVRLAGFAVLTAAVCLAGESARKLAAKARKAHQAGQVVEAYLLYAQAAAADPKSKEYWALSQALRTRALQEAGALPVLTTGESRTTEDPPFDSDLEGSAELLPPPELRPAAGTRSFSLEADHRKLFTDVFQAFGLDLVFDADYQAGARMRFQLENVDFRTALRALEAATGSFVVPLGEKLGMVYRDTQQKRAEGEPTVAVTFSLPHPVTVQEAQELARAVQQAFEIQKFAIDGASRLVLMRDRVSKVRAAQQLYQQLLTHRSQVMVEVELIELSDTRELSFGLDLPNATAMAFLGRAGGSGRAILGRRLGGLRLIPDVMPGFTRFLVVGGGWSTVAVAIANARAFANLSASSSQSLFRTYVRAVDSQAATVHIGDKYPIVTQRFLDVPDSVPVFAAPPTFNFEDLGLTLKVTPRIHDSTEVSLALETEFKVLGNGSFNGIPVIATRKFNSTVRLRDGEWAVVFGVLSESEARSISGLPGLAQLPVLSSLLASKTRSRNAGQALIVIKPRILDAANSQGTSASLYTGSEARWVTVP